MRYYVLNKELIQMRLFRTVIHFCIYFYLNLLDSSLKAKTLKSDDINLIYEKMKVKKQRHKI